MSCCSVCIEDACVSTQFESVRFQASKDCLAEKWLASHVTCVSFLTPRLARRSAPRIPLARHTATATMSAPFMALLAAGRHRKIGICSEVSVDVRYTRTCHSKAAETREEQDPFQSKCETYLSITFAVLIALLASWFVYKATIALVSCCCSNMPRRD